ncbi:MAG: excisionase family DNA-binding protein [Microbacterium sp.]
MSTADTHDVVSPGTDRTDQYATVLSFIDAHIQRRGSAPAAGFFLSGSAENDRVELSEPVYVVLRQTLEALSRGQSVSIVARDQEITTQQAAEILGISRPTVVQLIDKGELPAHVPGSVRRKLRLTDVLRYRETIRERRNRFIADTSEQYGDLAPTEVDSLLDDARRHVV